VAAVYDAHVQGIRFLDLGYGTHIHFVPSTKDVLLFLCCRDKQCENAYALWNEVRMLKGVGREYEMEAADLFADTVRYVIDYQGFTRSELKALDEQVAKAADSLRTALLQHCVSDDAFNNFTDESSAANWPDDYMTDIKRMLHGMPVSNELLLAPKKAHPLDQIDWPLPSRDDVLFWMLCHSVPTMFQMLEVLEQRATALSSSRFDAKKERQSDGDASDTRFIRRMTTGLIRRNPTAPADQIARIVSPIVDRVVGGKTFARCKKVAQRIRRDLETDGTASPS